MRNACLLMLLATTSGCHHDTDGGTPALSRTVEPAAGSAPAGPVAPVPVRAPLPPLVGLDGTWHEPPAVSEAAGPRLFAKALRAWVFATPSAAAARAYAGKLIAAGVRTIFREGKGQIHGSVTLRAAIPSAQDDVHACLRDLKILMSEA